MQEITRKTLLVSAKGGTVDYVNAEGEVLFSLPVPPGRVNAAEFLDLCPEGAEVQISGDGLVAIQPKGWASVQTVETHGDSGANPDYQPTSVDRLQRQMMQTVAQLAAQNRTMAARMAAFEKVERIPDAPQPTAKPEAEAVAKEAPVVE